MFPKNSAVRQLAFIVTGEVQERRLDDDSGEIEYHVVYTGADGQPHARWFKESELERAADAPAPKPAEGGAA